MHNDFLQRAIDLASQHSAHGEYGPFGAVIVHDGQIIGEGFNRVLADCDPTAHAEINALRAAAQSLGRPDLHDCVIYSSCEPCPMCLAAICWAHIPTVYYAASSQAADAAGFDDARIQDYLCSRGEHAGPELIRLDHPRANGALEHWANNPQRRGY